MADLKGGSAAPGGPEDSPSQGKVIAVQSGQYVVMDLDLKDVLEQLLLEQKITNAYLSLMTDEELTEDDVTDQGE